VPEDRWVGPVYVLFGVPVYVLFGVLTAVALLIGRRWPIVLVAYAALMAAVGLYVVVSGGGAWRRAFRDPAPAGAFRVGGLMIVASGIAIPAGFLLRSGLSTEPGLFGLLAVSGLVLLGCLATLYLRYGNWLNTDSATPM